MKKTQLTTTFILTFLLSSAIAMAQSTEIRNLSRFTKVAFSVPGNLNISIGSEFKVVLEGNKNFLSEIITEVSNDRLTIRRKEESKNWFRRTSGINNWTDKVTVNITMPAISDLSVAGSGTVEVFDSFKTNSLNLTVSGSGRLILKNVSSENLNCSITGSGRIVIDGDNSCDNANISVTGSGRLMLNNISGEELKCRTSGSGNIIIKGNGSFVKADIGMSGSGGYTGESLKLQTANINITGSGRCNCYVTNSLEARITGSGNVIYSGTPTKIDARATGSGRVRAR